MFELGELLASEHRKGGPGFYVPHMPVEPIRPLQVGRERR